MPSDSPETPSAAPHEHERMENFMEDINSRIARLSIALGISLHSDEDVVAAINQLRNMTTETERRLAPDRRTASRTGTSAERRVSYFRAELRGLLVLRYGVEQRLIERMGYHETRQILTEAEAHLLRNGFAPGVDGMLLGRDFESQ